MRDEINQTAAAGGLAERSGLHVALTFHLYFLELEDASDRAIFKEAYARASRYNQTICDERNGNESVRSESAENEEDGPSTEGEKLMMSPRHNSFFSALFFAKLYLILATSLSSYVEQNQTSPCRVACFQNARYIHVKVCKYRSI